MGRTLGLSHWLEIKALRLLVGVFMLSKLKTEIII